jgi:hypothetical protein
MTAKKPRSNRKSTKRLIESVRVYLSRRFVQRVVSDHGMAAIFFQSQSWPGYQHAFDSWHRAFWNWIDNETPAQAIQQWKAFQFNGSSTSPAAVAARIRAEGFELPVGKGEEKQWIEELFRQEHFQSISVFQLAMRGPEATDSMTYDLFARSILIASEIGDDTFTKEFARQKNRKPTKGKSDRRLKSQLLVCWIPGCLWAFTTGGISQFLNHHYPRSGNKPYDHKTISDARRALNLYRSSRPLWWGMEGTPPCLKPLR